jgi:hypothetical protein
MNWKESNRVSAYYRVNVASGEKEALPFTESQAGEVGGEFIVGHGISAVVALMLVNKWNRQANNPIARVRWQYFI